MNKFNKCIISTWEEKEGNHLTADNLIRINPNKPRYGSLKLVAEDFMLNGGFLGKRKRIGFVVSEVSMLMTIIKHFNLVEGMDFSESVAPHRIVVIEKLECDTPENKGFKEKINPSTREFLLRDEEQIMWKTEVVPESSNIQDILISYNETVPMDNVHVGNDKFRLADDDLIFVGEAKVDISISRKNK
jgi:hypothetical protein